MHCETTPSFDFMDILEVIFVAVVVLVVTVNCSILGLAKGRDALWSKHVRQAGADEKLALNKGPDYGATSQSIVVTMS